MCQNHDYSVNNFVLRSCKECDKLYMRTKCAERGMDVNQFNVLTSHHSSGRPRFPGPEDPLYRFRDVFAAPDEVTEPLPIGPSEVTPVPAEHWMNTGQNTEATGPVRRASAKPRPPQPSTETILATRPMPKMTPASRRSSIRNVVDETVERVTRLPRSMWSEEIQNEAEVRQRL